MVNQHAAQLLAKINVNADVTIVMEKKHADVAVIAATVTECLKVTVATK